MPIQTISAYLQDVLEGKHDEKYIVQVHGNALPTVAHDTEEEALAEAERIMSTLPANASHRIYIAKITHVLHRAKAVPPPVVVAATSGK